MFKYLREDFSGKLGALNKTVACIPSFPSDTWECSLDRVAVCIYTGCSASKNVFPSNAWEQENILEIDA
jgi:hypothetical protein